MPRRQSNSPSGYGWGTNQGWGTDYGWGQPASRSSSYTPETERSLLAEIARKGVSTLQTAGTIFDTPGSVVRGLVAGEPGRAFGGILDPEQRVEPEELTGWKSNEYDPWYEKVGKFAGNTGVAIGLDPFTYMTLGASAIGKAGRFAKSADLLEDATTLATRSKNIPGAIGKRTTRMLSTPEKIIEAMPIAQQEAAWGRWNRALEIGGVGADEAKALRSERLGGLVGFGLPFGKSWGTLGGAGAETVARGMDTAGNAVRWSGPGRTAAALMNAKVMGATSRQGQENAAMLYHALPRVEAAARGDVNDLGRLVNQLGLTDDANSKRKLTAILEAPDETALASAIKDVAGNSQTGRAIAQKLRSTHDAANKNSFTQQNLVGAGPETPLQDQHANYMARHMAVPSRIDRGRAIGGTQTAEELGRREFYGDIPGGTNTLREVTGDPEITKMLDAGATEKEIAEYIKVQHGHVIPPTYQTREDIAKATELQNLGVDPLDIKKAILERDRYMAIAKNLSGMPREAQAGGVFANHPLMDFATARTGAKRAVARAEMSLDALATPGALIEGIEKSKRAARIEGSVPLHELLQKLGIRHGDEELGGMKALADRTGKTIDELKLARVNKDVADDLLKVSERFTSPEAAGTIGHGIDSLTNAWKSAVTAFPAFHSRNVGSGQAQAGINFGTKAWGENAGVMQMMRGMDVPSYVTHPDVIAEAKRQGITNLGPHEATNIMRELTQQHSVLDRFVGEASSRVGEAGEAIGSSFNDYVKQFPGGLEGQSPSSLKKLWDTFRGKEPGMTKKPAQWVDGKLQSNVRGIGDAAETTFGPLAANEMVGNASESVNRIPSWIALTRQGVDPVQAKRLVDSAQVAYAGRHYTPTEQQLMRLFPFYKFSSRMAKHTVKQLAEQPGGPLAQVIKATGNAGDTSDMTLPDYLKQSISIPVPEGTPLIGPEPGGDPRYLTGFGLMHEQDPFGFLSGPGLQGVGLEALSRMNPLLKGPIEAATGVSAFQRGPAGPRALEDQDPLVGRLIQNVSDMATGERTRNPVRFPGSRYVESLVGNSPLSRLLSTSRTLTDPRKSWSAAGLNTLTGARVTDVSQRSQEAQVGQELKALMKAAGAKDFENVYFSKAQQAAMTEEQREWATRAMALKQMFAKRQRERAKAAAR